MSEAIRVGMSPCPNDTFMFHAMMHGQVPSDGLRFTPVMDDIEGLNRRAFGEDPLPITKLSACAFGHLTSRYRALRAGAALGRGCGPLVVVREDSPMRSMEDLAGARLAIPGERTTAWLLAQIFGPRELTTSVHRFDGIMPRVRDGADDAGLVIHEGRFTYARYGLRVLADLGVLWESQTDLPLPLGLIAAHHELAVERAVAARAALSASVRFAWEHPSASAAWVRAHAQEMDPEVCRAHIGLYVNEFSSEVGEIGARAVACLLSRGREVGALPTAAAVEWV